jgi:hypothetical protein
MSAKIVEIGKDNLANVPEMLRKIADRIEAYEYMDDIQTAIVITSDGCSTIVSSCGPASDYHYTLATLLLAQIQLVR